MIKCIQNLVELCPSILKIFSKKTISDINQGPKLRCKFAGKMSLYNSNIDLVNDIVYKIWLNSVHPFSRYWTKQIVSSIKGCNSVANLRKITIYKNNLELVHDNVYTKFG